MSSFQDLGVFVHNNHEAEAQKSSAQAAHALSLPARNSLGQCLRVLVNMCSFCGSVDLWFIAFNCDYLD